MGTGHHPSVAELWTVTSMAAQLPETMRRHTEVGLYWRGILERESGAFDDAWARALEEYREALDVAGKSVSGANGADRYAALVERLKLRDPARRGSGMLTAIASVGLLWCEPEPEKAMQLAANQVGTDTDTIASMAGALVGVAADSEPPIEVLDAALFRLEADRLTKIACGRHLETRQYPYPDLLHWSAPTGRADVLAQSRDGGLYVRGLGPAQKKGEAKSSPSGDFLWQWIMLESGQSLLIKRRGVLEVMEDETGRLAGQESLFSTSNGGGEGLSSPIGRKPAKSDVSTEIARPGDSDGTPNRAPCLDLQRAIDYMVRHKNDDKALGSALRRVVDRGTTGQIAAFTGALIDELLKSRKTRQEHGGLVGDDRV